MFTHKISHIVTILLLACLGCLTPTATAQFFVPLIKAQQSEHRFAKITIDGITLNMLVDTGASITIIDQSVATTLFKDKPLTLYKGSQGNIKSRIQLMPITSIKSGKDTLFHSGHIKVLDMGPAFTTTPERIQGVLGLDAFSFCVIVFSAQNARVSVYPDALPPKHKVWQGATELSCDFEGGCFFVKQFTAYDREGKPLCNPTRALLDTGATMSTLSPKAWLGDTQEGNIHINDVNTKTRGAKAARYAFPYMVTLSAPKQPFAIIANTAPILIATMDHNLIGMTVLRLGDLILDMRNKRAFWRWK